MANATIAIMITLDDQHEGGFQKNPNDRANWTGGEIGVGTLVGTNGGITPADMPGADIEHLTMAQKIAFYTERYWKPLYNEITDQSVANKIFDMGVLFGIGDAVEDLQRAINVNPPPALHVDGNFGPETLLLTNEQAPVKFLSDFKVELKTRAHGAAVARPAEAQFLPDWLRRIDS